MMWGSGQRALSADEVSELTESGIPSGAGEPWVPGLIAYWPISMNALITLLPLRFRRTPDVQVYNDVEWVSKRR